MDKDRYWASKRRKEPEERILDACGAAATWPAYREARLSRIESRDYLAHDTIQEGAVAVLERVGMNHEQILVTLRNDPSNLLWQLEELALHRHFSSVLSSGQETDPRWRMKADLIREYLKNRGEESPHHVLITDTDTDVRSGQELGFWTLAVAEGIRERSILAAAHPDRLLDRTLDLLDPDVFPPGF